MNKLFEVVEVRETEVYVAITTTKNTNAFWLDLEQELRSLGHPDAIVYLDFVLRHGVNNRFFSTKYEKFRLRVGISKAGYSENLIRIFNRYFSSHLPLIMHSLMTQRERIFPFCPPK